MYNLRFRQIHLDYHTSPAIDGIGAAFDKKEWQETLKLGHVDSITCFSKCHHGWSYHPTKVGQVHPHLKYDLLRAQFDACKEINVNVPVYISAGLDSVITIEHPEWRELRDDGKFAGWAGSPLHPGFEKLCFNSPYLEYLCAQIREAVELFPNCDGIFLDIISQGQCCCRWCMAGMLKAGLKPEVAADRQAWSRQVLLKYYRETTAAVRSRRSDMPVFHNSGHIPRGDRELLPFLSHLELESLPTGGWGYDHFPLSAKYCKKLDLDLLGMTGKFHTTWGEFGGFKHPNALRYECAAMVAYGSKCSVGDQLHPNGKLDRSTYSIIGAAYAEVEAKEPWCDHATPVADIGLLSSEAQRLGPASHSNSRPGDTGATRVLLEGHFLFDVLDGQMDFSPYKLLILPDDILVDAALQAKLEKYLAGGGKLLLSGESGLKPDRSGFAFDLGATWEGQSPFRPDYILPAPELRPDFVSTPLIMYLPSQRIKATTGQALGDIHDPYFNRTYRHFCSHQHAPNRPEPSGYHCGVRQGNLVYLAHPIFSIYANFGAVAYKDFAVKAIESLLGERTVKAGLPSTGRLSLMRQAKPDRLILHLLYANTIKRGDVNKNIENGVREAVAVEVIEDLLPLNNVTVSLKPGRPVKSVTLEPQGKPLSFAQKNGEVSFTVEEFTCHQMVVLA